MSKFIFLSANGERAIEGDGRGNLVEFKQKEKAYEAAREFAQTMPGDEIEIYERIAVAIVPTLHAIVTPDADDAIERIRKDIGKSPDLAAPYGKPRKKIKKRNRPAHDQEG